MTPDEIRAEINSDPAIKALMPDTVAMSVELSKKKKKYVPTEIGKGTIIEVLGLPAANSVLDAVLSSADYRHVKELLEQGRLRLDVSAKGGLLQPLVTAGIITQEKLDLLCDRSRVKDEVSDLEVRVAVFNDDGSLRI